MRSLSRFSAMVACAFASSVTSAWAEAPVSSLPDISLPPVIENLIGMPQPYTLGRKAHLDLIKREAEQAGLPPDVADAVAQVESAYNPGAVGGVGEVGLMQIRPTTAAMLGYKGTLTGLFAPETNVRYGVMYLARAWQLADGNLCRALMKYRAGHGEENMTPLSVEYCRRVRNHLLVIGSPLGTGSTPANVATSTPFGAHRATAAAAINAVPKRAALILSKSDANASIETLQVLPPQRATKRLMAAKVSPGKARPEMLRQLAFLREREKVRKTKSRQMWAAHNIRMAAIASRLKPEHLRIASGI